jgi:hypothetical protein
MILRDLLAAGLAGLVTVGLLAGFDIASGGAINWPLDVAIGAVVAVGVAYLRTADLEDAEVE